VISKASLGTTTVTVGPLGGTLAVRTPSGTSVRLIIPAGALGQDTKITLVPFAGLRRVPFPRGIAGAVQLRPEGLVLAKPARLLFRPRKPVPRSVQTPFSATGSGNSFHVYPGRTGRVLALPIMHFSIYGEGEATRAERVAEGTRAQSTPEATIERDAAQSPSDAELARAFIPFAKRVAAEVSEALTDDSAVSEAVNDGLSLAEELRLVGWSSDVLPDMGDRIPKSVPPQLSQLIQQIRASFPNKILDNALARAVDRCRAEHSQASRDHVMSILQIQRLVGETDAIDPSLLNECYGYELLYTHTSAGQPDYSWDHGSGQYTYMGTYSESRNVTVSADIELTRAADGTYGGSGPLQFTSKSWSTTETVHTNEGQAGPTVWCDATLTHSLTSAADGTLVAAGFAIGDAPTGIATLTGLTETWHYEWNETSGPCKSVTDDYAAATIMTNVGHEHDQAGDQTRFITDPSTGRASAVEIHLDTGWVPGSGATPGTGSVVATRTLSGNENDLGPDVKPDIPYTDKFELLRTTT
jgi:hypothetical protein